MLQVTLTEEQHRVLIIRQKRALDSATSEWKPRVPFESELLAALENAIPLGEN